LSGPPASEKDNGDHEHTAIVEKLDGKTVDWMEKVSDEQYLA
jgi:hypothetical protein